MLDKREQDIVISAQQGNRSAFGELVQRYQNLVTSIAFSSTGDLQRSEDIAQQAFLVAWEKRTELRDPRRFGGWLRAFASNVTLNSNRKSKRLDRSATSLETQNEPISIDLPEDRLATKEQETLLWASLKNIPEDYREPLVLFYRENQSAQEVAQQMGLSVDAVKQRLARGRAMLKSEVEQFVEDLLGFTKPSASFSSAIVAMLPAASAATSKAIVQGGVALGAKSLLGKIGFLFSGSFLGALGGVLGGAIGIWASWYGVKAAERHATSDDEKRLLWWFYKSVVVMTVAITLASIVVFWLAPESIRFFWVVGSTAIYTLVLGAQIVYFIDRQTKLHQLHGKPDVYTDVVATPPSSRNGFRCAVAAVSIVSWVWVFVLAGMKQDWIVISLAIPLALGHLVWSLLGADAQITAPNQIRFQAMALLRNSLLACLLVLIASFSGTRMDFTPVSGWTLCLGVGSICWLLAGIMWWAASKADQHLAQSP